MGKGAKNKNLNPADRQRKLERQRELKRNKKQRIEVRKALLKNKNTDEILEQMRHIDQMAYDAANPPTLPLLVLDNKRQKLRDTYIRVMVAHKRENETGAFQRMKDALNQYDEEKAQMEAAWRAVKFAAETAPDDIPLPCGSAAPGAALTPASVLIAQAAARQNLPTQACSDFFVLDTKGVLQMLLPAGQKRPQGILKQDRRPPGPPPGAPAYMTDDEGSDSEDESGKRRSGRVRFADDNSQVVEAGEDKDSRMIYKQVARELSDDRRGAGGRAVPPPPPGLPPHLAAQQMSGLNIGAHATSAPQRQQASQYVPPPTNAAVIESAPQIHARPTSSQTSTFESKAQLRNLKREVTRLVPTAIQVQRRPQVALTTQRHRPAAPSFKQSAASTHFAPQHAAPKKEEKKSVDDAYSQFMKEMQGLL